MVIYVINTLYRVLRKNRSIISKYLGIKNGNFCLFLIVIIIVTHDEIPAVESVDDKDLWRVWVNNIRYADDTVLIVDNMEALRDMLGTVGECSKNMGLNINTKKTKFMIITRKPQEFQNSSLTYKKRVNKFKSRNVAVWKLRIRHRNQMPDWKCPQCVHEIQKSAHQYWFRSWLEN